MKNQLQFYPTIFILFILSTIMACNSTNEIKSNPTPSMQGNIMHSIGLIGGLSWHSTIDYYSAINQAVNDHFGNNTNPPLVLYNVNQAKVHRFQKENKWDSIALILIDGANHLVAAKVEAIVFCANTPHKVFEQVQSKLIIPIIHIGDATAQAIKKKDISSVAFIGTKYTMEDDFITSRLQKEGIQVLLPESNFEIEELQRIIEEELTFGTIKPASKDYIKILLEKLIAKGAKGVVLGCTEFPLMFTNEDFDVPVFNTTTIHAEAATTFILGNN